MRLRLTGRAKWQTKYYGNSLFSKPRQVSLQESFSTLRQHTRMSNMRDYAIGRAFVDVRAQRIYGGTNEIMKEIISRMN